MSKVMLDINILVKFAFIYQKLIKGTAIPKALKKFKELLDLYERAEFKNVMSEWNRLELRDVLMRLKLAEIYFLSGYSTNEFHDARDEGIKLKRESIDGVNEIVFDIWKFSFKTTKDMKMKKIQRLTKMGYSTFDMVLLHQAELSECDYFVTQDGKLRQNEELDENFKVKICSVKEFLEKIKNEAR